MKGYVITIMDNEQSVKAAERCIASAKRRGVDAEIFEAITPRNTNIFEVYEQENIPTVHFTEKYSRHQPVLAAFLSHYNIWKKIAETKEAAIVLEHDAFFVDSINERLNGNIVNIGKPSYGKYNTPAWIGEYPLFSKKYLPGAHAYYVTPHGAESLISRAHVDAGPTDIFIHKDRFLNLITEYYPWPVECRDTFTTIQNEQGCLAKHNYDENYKII